MAPSASFFASFGVILVVLLLQSKNCEGVSLNETQTESIKATKIETMNSEITQNFVSLHMSAPTDKPASSFWDQMLGDGDDEENEVEDMGEVRPRGYYPGGYKYQQE